MQPTSHFFFHKILLIQSFSIYSPFFSFSKLKNYILNQFNGKRTKREKKSFETNSYYKMTFCMPFLNWKSGKSYWFSNKSFKKSSHFNLLRYYHIEYLGKPFYYLEFIYLFMCFLAIQIELTLNSALDCGVSLCIRNL